MDSKNFRTKMKYVQFQSHLFIGFVHVCVCRCSPIYLTNWLWQHHTPFTVLQRRFMQFFFVSFNFFLKVDPLKDVRATRLHVIRIYYWRAYQTINFLSRSNRNVCVCYVCNLLWLNFHYFISLRFIGVFSPSFLFLFILSILMFHPCSNRTFQFCVGLYW